MDEEQLTQLLTTGCNFLKYGRKGKPHRCLVSCTPGLDRITWGKASSTVNASDLLEVRVGRSTDVFARFDGQFEPASHYRNNSNFSLKSYSSGSRDGAPDRSPSKSISKNSISFDGRGSTENIPFVPPQLPRTPSKREMLEKLSFSLVFRDRTLDLEVLPASAASGSRARLEETRESYVAAFRWLIHKLRQKANLNFSGTDFEKTFEVHTHSDCTSGCYLMIFNRAQRPSRARTYVYHQVVSKLGEGAYGSVFKVRHRVMEVFMAAKTMEVASEAAVEDFRHEIETLQQCESFYIVGYIGCWGPDADKRLWVMMDYCEVGSVANLYEHEESRFTEPQIGRILHSTLMALVYLNGKNLVHRDVKAGNILVNKFAHVKLADFGVSKKAFSDVVSDEPKEAVSSNSNSKESDVTSIAAPGGGGDEIEIAGSPLWMAPEVLKGSVDFKSDIWSLGITAIELGERKVPYSEATSTMRVMRLIKNNAPPTLKESHWSPLFNDFIAKCLVKESTARASAVDLLSHPFITTSMRGADELKPLVDQHIARASAEGKSKTSKNSILNSLAKFGRSWGQKRAMPTQTSVTEKSAPPLPSTAAPIRAVAEESDEGDSDVEQTTCMIVGNLDEPAFAVDIGGGSVRESVVPPPKAVSTSSPAQLTTATLSPRKSTVTVHGIPRKSVPNGASGVSSTMGVGAKATSAPTTPKSPYKDSGPPPVSRMLSKPVRKLNFIPPRPSPTRASPRGTSPGGPSSRALSPHGPPESSVAALVLCSQKELHEVCVKSGASAEITEKIVAAAFELYAISNSKLNTILAESHNPPPTSISSSPKYSPISSFRQSPVEANGSLSLSTNTTPQVTPKKNVIRPLPMQNPRTTPEAEAVSIEETAPEAKAVLTEESADKVRKSVELGADKVSIEEAADEVRKSIEVGADKVSTEEAADKVRKSIEVEEVLEEFEDEEEEEEEEVLEEEEEEEEQKAKADSETEDDDGAGVASIPETSKVYTKGPQTTEVRKTAAKLWLQESSIHVCTLSRNDISTLKRMKNSATGPVKAALIATAIVLGATPTAMAHHVDSRDKNTGKIIRKFQYWPSAQKILSDTNFLRSLKRFDFASLSPDVITRLYSYCTTINPSMSPSVVTKASRPAGVLWDWIRSIYHFAVTWLDFSPPETGEPATALAEFYSD